jgi:hypothetical protein
LPISSSVHRPQLKLRRPDNFGRWEKIDLRWAFNRREPKLKVRGDQQWLRKT